MAQLTRGTGNSKPKLCSPPGYEVIDKGTATEVIAAGELCVIGASGWSKTAAGATDADGVALKDYIAGQEGCDFLIQGEIDGYGMSGGITPGIDIYPSASVAGGMQSDAVAATTLRIKATTPTRLRFNFT